MVPNIALTEKIITDMPSKTFSVDFKEGKIKFKTDNLDAIIQSSIISLQTEKNNFKIFSDDYGSELHKLIGKEKDFVFSEAKRMISSTLLNDVRIADVKNFIMLDNVITFDIISIYGTSQLTWEVVD